MFKKFFFILLCVNNVLGMASIKDEPIEEIIKIFELKLKNSAPEAAEKVYSEFLTLLDNFEASETKVRVHTSALRIMANFLAKKLDHITIKECVKFYQDKKNPGMVIAVLYGINIQKKQTFSDLPIYTPLLTTKNFQMFEWVVHQEDLNKICQLFHYLIQPEPIDIKFLEILLKNGAKINLLDEWGQTVLEWIAFYKSIFFDEPTLKYLSEVESLLIKHGAKLLKDLR